MNLYLGSGLFGVLVVLGVLALSRRPEQGTATAIGIVLSAGFALGVILLSARDGFSKDLTAFTVGQILTVGTADLVAVSVVGVIVAVLVTAGGRQLTFRAFDPEGHAAAGYGATGIDLALLLAVEAVILVAVPAVGAILAVAVLVAPAAIARLWTRDIPAMTAVAVAVGSRLRTGRRAHLHPLRRRRRMAPSPSSPGRCSPSRSPRPPPGTRSPAMLVRASRG